jgi:hypothetical protein
MPSASPDRLAPGRRRSTGRSRFEESGLSIRPHLLRVNRCGDAGANVSAVVESGLAVDIDSAK